MRRFLVAASLLAVLVLLAAACAGGGGGQPSGGGGGTTINVTMVDYKFEPSELTLNAGTTYTINVTNKGSLVHDFTIPDWPGGKVSLKLDPGKSGSLTLKADKPGTYQLVCEEPGHKELGMVGKVIVK